MAEQPTLEELQKTQTPSVPLGPSDNEPVRGEHFSIEHLEEHARRIALAHAIGQVRPNERQFLARLRDNCNYLHQAYQTLTTAVQQGETIPPDAEWLLDNFYIVEEQLREINQDLPRHYYRELPKLVGGALAGYPRVYALAIELILHTDNSLDETTLTRFVSAYQESAPLGMGEVWAVPIMLRIGLVENLRRLAVRILAGRAQRAAADRCADEMIARRSEPGADIAACMGRHTLDGRHLPPRFVAHLIERLRDQGPELAPSVHWLESQLAGRGQTIEDTVRQEYQQQAADQVSIGNAITSMRLLSSLDWPVFFEGTNLTERLLCQDPAGVYARMSFATRDRYRHVVEDFARRARLSEMETAQRLLELARTNSADPSSTPDTRKRHIGYYLIGPGRERLEADLRVRPRLRERVHRVLEDHAISLYLGSIFLVTAALLTGLIFAFVAAGGSSAAVVVLALLASWPMSELAVSAINYLATTVVGPRVLPKLELKDEIPPSCRTAVVMPTMLFSSEGVHHLLEHLEIHYLANPDPGLCFALLTDFADARQAEMPEDSDLLAKAVKGIRDLNTRHATSGPGPFLLCHRARRWDPNEQAWMGWERKRGKLLEFNRLLRGATDTTYTLLEGDRSRLGGVKYVITLDSDTQLPRGAARQLIGTLAHPLNQARFDPSTGRVEDGYGILQPRVGIFLWSALRSPFARAFAGNPGLDPYTTAVSDVYQDLFGEGSFTGKGIYDVDAFEAALGETFPENTILSHDLIEGCHARVGLVTDIMLFDEFPARYHAYARRLHRWVRGDWQLLPWLLPWVPTAQGRRRNPLTALSRWKVFDNLRRSLVWPTLLAFLIAGWIWLPGSAWLWTLAALAVVAFPLAAHLGTTVLFHGGLLFDLAFWQRQVQELRHTLAQTILMLAFIPHQAHIMTDAIVRTLVRLGLTRRPMLEWETASATERRLGAHAWSFMANMWFAPVAAAVAITCMPSSAYAAGLPLALLWLFSPLIAFYVSQPFHSAEVPLGEEDRLALRRLARKTWSYFERFVSAEDNWLPPDNYQEHPKEVLARRLSPTNEGLYLVSALAAYDFGYLSQRELADVVERNLNGLDRLERYHGHFFNWYDTATRQVLRPRYVSTVDSGNLAACLLTLRQGLLDALDEPLLGPRVCDGLHDTARLLQDTVEGIHPPGARFVNPDLDALNREAAEVVARTRTPPITLPEWQPFLDGLETTVAAMPDLVQRFRTEIHLQPEVLLFRVQRLAEQVRALRHDWQEFLSWVPLTTARLSSKSLGTDSIRYWQTLWNTLVADFSLRGLVRAAESSETEFTKLREVSTPADRDNVELLEKVVHTAAQAAGDLIRRVSGLVERCETLALETDFRQLYDSNRKLFAIGYNLEDARLDRSYYDLLASEARLASFVAIGKGDAEQRHWFQLGRPLTEAVGTRLLLSWGGTMFEYMMPVLFTRLYPDTLLGHTCAAAVDRQIEYGRQQGGPWGISESAFSAVSSTLNYHYQSFGVPGLGLKRGLARDLVVSPYSTALALMVRPKEALANFKALASAGADGLWGLYEAIDYTPERVPAGQKSLLVRCYMAHHQGMTLVALTNALRHNLMQRRFHANSLVRATELLLQERLPTAVPVLLPHSDEVESVRLVRDAIRPVSRRITSPDTVRPRTQILSNGQYQLAITNAGTGFSTCFGAMLTRWRPDVTCDPWGSFLYFRDLRTGMVWSASYQPVRREPDSYEVTYSSDKAEFRRRDGDIETHMEVAVSPENNAEVRQVTLTNHSWRLREVEITSYAELCLAPYSADLAHPAFSKLFIETEYLPDSQALLARRRPRAADQEPLWAVCVLATESGSQTPLEYETDRTRFLGRGRTPENPAALEAGAKLSRSTGAVLDPIFSWRCRLRLPPGGSARFALTLGAAKSRSEAEALAEHYHDPRTVMRALELAWAHSQVELRHLHLSPGSAHIFQQAASFLLYPNPAGRAPEPVLAANKQGQQGLWRYSVSGDYPMVLVRVSEQEQLGLVREMLLAHEYWRARGLTVDLVVLNEHAPTYQDALQEDILAMIRSSSARSLLDKRGGVFALRGSQVPESDRILLRTVAAQELLGERGSLARQIDRTVPAAPLPARFVPETRRRPAREPASDSSTTPTGLEFSNGLGGFSADGSEYVIHLAATQWTPAPWINVIANPSFGFLVSEAGTGYTWAENSRENKLTPWANDPVSDPAGEAIYLRDDETGEIWSPTPLPVRRPEPYTVRHRPGSTRFEHQSGGIAQEVLISAAPTEPIKFVCVRLRNRSGRPRRLSATYYAEWVLGVSRESSQTYVVTEVDEESGALLARNAYNQDFGHRLAFLTVLGSKWTFTGDRTEFFGRNGSRQRPAALERVELSNRTGAGFDPCGAVQTQVRLQPNAEAEVIFLLGQCDNRTELRALLEQYNSANRVHEAFAATEKFWRAALGTVQVRTPNAALDVLMNHWLLYQVLSCRLWGRSALYQSGGAFGFRDQLQDAMALVFARPDETRAQIMRAASRQFEPGDVQHWWHPPGNRGIRTRFSDDYLWLPFVLCFYLEKTGDHGLLDERVGFLHSPPLDEHEDERYELPDLSTQSDTIFGHCVRAVDHAFRFGEHGLPLMGCGDWNDGMNKVGAGGKGESVWVGWFLLNILERFTPIVEARGDHDRAAFYRAAAVKLRQAIEDHAWDGAWYRRAYYDDGTPLGSAQSEECQIDSLTQSWAVIAGGNPERARQSMRSVNERLVQRADRLILLFVPPFDQTARDPGYIKGYLPGIRENGGQYTHAALWVVQAFALMGDGDTAMELFDLLNPIRHGDSAQTEDKYKVEPYVVAADVYGRPPHTGRGGWTWYTGSAGWMYRVALENILGFDLRGDHLRFNPCIPSEWDGFELTYQRGRTRYVVRVENPNHVQHGVREVWLDGRAMADDKVPLVDDGREHQVRVRMV